MKKKPGKEETAARIANLLACNTPAADPDGHFSADILTPTVPGKTFGGLAEAISGRGPRNTDTGEPVKEYDND